MITLEINGRRVEVDDSFRNLPPEQQEATVNEIAASFGDMGNAAPQAASQEDPGAMGWVNRGIAGSLDSLVGLANYLPNAAIRAGAGALGIEDPFQFGTTPTADIMDMSGIARAQSEPETWGQQLLTGAGEGIGSLVPVGAAAQGLARLPGIAGGIGSSIANSFAAAPVSSLAGEVAAGAGSRLGGEIAAEAAGGEYGELARPFGALAGGVAAALAPGAIGRGGIWALDKGTQYAPVIGAARSAIARGLAPFTESGAREVASRSLRGIVSDPEAAAASIQPDARLTAAQQTNEPGLMSLEREIIERNPTLRPQFEQRNTDALRGIESELQGFGGNIADTTEYLGGRIGNIMSKLDERVAKAEADAQARIEKLSPQRAASENSLIVREELDKAYSAAKAEENQLWGQVPDNIMIPTGNAKRALMDAIEFAGPVSADSIPAKAKQWLGGDGFGPEASVRDVQRLYSELRQTARNARSGETPNAMTAKAADDIADAILRDFDSVGDGAGEAYRNARTYTAKMRDIFNKGAVGRSRQRTRGDDSSIPPELILDRTIGSGGARGALAIDELTGATGGAAQPAIDDFLLGRLASRGEPTPTRIESFRRAYEEPLSRSPSVAQALSEAEASRGAVDAASGRRNSVAEALAQSPAGVMANAPTEKAIAKSILNAPSPETSAAKLAQQTRKNPAAREGLKGGVVAELLDKSRGEYLRSGDRAISGNTMNGLLNDSKMRGAFEKILSPAEMKRLESVAKELQALEASRSATPSGKIVDAEPNKLIMYLGGTMAARFGAQMGAGTSGASLRTASAATKNFERIMRNLTGGRAEQLVIDAVTKDPELLKALLTSNKTKADFANLNRRIKMWAEGYGFSELSRAMEDDEVMLDPIYLEGR